MTPFTDTLPPEKLLSSSPAPLIVIVPSQSSRDIIFSPYSESPTQPSTVTSRLPAASTKDILPNAPTGKSSASSTLWETGQPDSPAVVRIRRARLFFVFSHISSLRQHTC